MKTLIVQVPLSDQDVALLTSRYLIGELEKLCAIESEHVLSSLINDIKSNIQYVETDVIEE